jgi:hypothetical protein
LFPKLFFATIFIKMANNVGIHFATFLNQTIFPGIIQGLGRRGIATTSEELMTMVGGPSTPSVPRSNNVIPFPGVFPGASPIPGSAGVVPGISEGRCTRILSRGKRKHQICGEKLQPGSNLCSSCTRVGTKKSTVVAVEVPDVVEAPEPVSINVQPFDLAQGLHREQVHGFILKQFDDRVVVYGRTKEGDTIITGLTPDQQRQAQEMGFSLV